MCVVCVYDGKLQGHDFCSRLSAYDPTAVPDHAAGTASDCRYSVASTTPVVAGVAPASGGAGTAINVTGSNLSGTVAIRFMAQQQQAAGSISSGNTLLQQAVPAGSCSVAAAAAGWATCTAVPNNLSAGQFLLVLERSNGELSVDPLKVGKAGHTAYVFTDRCWQHLKICAGPFTGAGGWHNAAGRFSSSVLGTSNVTLRVMGAICC